MLFCFVCNTLTFTKHLNKCIKTSNNKTTQHTIRSFRTWTNVGSCGCNIFDSLVYWSCRHAIVRIARFYRVDLLTSMENTTNTYQRSYRESHFFFSFFSLSTFPHSVCSRLLFPFSVLCILYIWHILPFHLKKTFIFLPHLRFKTIWFIINTRMGELVQHESTVFDCDSPNEWKPCSICLASANRKVDNFQIVILNRKCQNITNYRNSVNCRPPMDFIWFLNLLILI